MTQKLAHSNQNVTKKLVHCNQKNLILALRNQDKISKTGTPLSKRDKNFKQQSKNDKKLAHCNQKMTKNGTLQSGKNSKTKGTKKGKLQ